MISSSPSSSFSHSSSISSSSCYPSTSPRLSSKIPCAISPRIWGQLTSPLPTRVPHRVHDRATVPRATVHRAKSCSPSIVKTANGEVQTYEEATVYGKELDIFLTMKVFENTPDILLNGSMVKNHISFYTGFGYSATRRTSFLSWFQACQIRLLDLTQQPQGHFQDRGVIAQHLLRGRLLHQLQQHQVTVRLEKERIKVRLIPLQCLCQVQMLMIERGNPLFADSGRASSEIPEWVQECRENLVDERVPEHRDSHASSSHEVSSEPTFKRREDLGKHSVYTHFPEDRNCEICKRTKITRAPCRRRNGGAVPRAENFW